MLQREFKVEKVDVCVPIPTCYMLTGRLEVVKTVKYLHLPLQSSPVPPTSESSRRPPRLRWSNGSSRRVRSTGTV